MKRLKTLFLLLLIFMLTACSKSSGMTVELVIGVSGIDDRSFNQGTWEAIQKFSKERNIPEGKYNYTHSMTTEELVTNLSVAADKNPSVIIAPGYYFEEPVDIISNKYPDQKIVLLDTKINNKPNVFSVTFADNEGSFLAGIAAGLKAKSEGKKIVGFLGGVDLPIIQEFEAGFVYGVHTIDSEIKVLSEFSNDFANPVLGEKLAKNMYDEGAYIIYNVAGDTGNGTIKEAKKRSEKGNEVWVIGVDKDQYEDGIYKDGKSVILTSMLKKLNVATYEALVKVENGTFKGGHVIYRLANNGVGLPDENPNLDNNWVTIINKYRAKVISEEIKVPEKMSELKAN